MDKETTKSLKIFAIGVTVFLLIFFFAICLRIFAKRFLVQGLGISNSFTEFIFPDAINQDNETTEVDIDWKKIYPFKDENGNVIADDTNEESDEEKSLSKIDTVMKGIQRRKEKIEGYTTDDLPLYTKITELAGSYEQLMLWNFAQASEYNNITKLSDGYLVGIQEKIDVSEAAEATIEFANYCKDQGIEFLYINIPSKICSYEDDDISGTIDFSNQNEDEFLKKLQDAGVTTYDHRDDIHNEEIIHHSLFFKTDHHWTGQAGLWAAQHILSLLKNEYGYNLNVNILDNNNFEEVVYEDWFLGSQGRKVTLSVADPEDISLFYPKFETLIHYEIPTLVIDEHGGFEITYDMNHIEEKDYYNKNPYGAYNHADQALIRIENELIDDGPRVLIIHKSFSNCVIPFMSMGIKYIDSIDRRHFDGSIQSFIQQEKPDLVIVTYNDVGSSVEFETHSNVYDFK